MEERELIEIYLPGKGGSWRLAGPENVDFYIEGIRHIKTNVIEMMPYMPARLDRVVIPVPGGSPLLPVIASVCNPEAQVDVFEMDNHHFRRIGEAVEEIDNVNVHLTCDASEVEGEKQGAVLAIDDNAERLLMFDIIERMNHILPDGSPVVIAVPKKREKDFLKKKLMKLFRNPKVVARTRAGAVFTGLTVKEKDCWSSRRVELESDTAVGSATLVSRPGVFCHGRVDGGGAALAESVDLKAGEQVLELGCGNGLVSLTLLKKAQAAGVTPKHVLMVDSHIRATKSVEEAIEINELQSLADVKLTDQYEGKRNKFDVVIGNPPYYADHRIASYFIETAARVLKPGGKLYLVSKHAELMRELTEEEGFTVVEKSRKGYDISICTKA